MNGIHLKEILVTNLSEIQSVTKHKRLQIDQIYDFLYSDIWILVFVKMKNLWLNFLWIDPCSLVMVKISYNAWQWNLFLSKMLLNFVFIFYLLLKEIQLGYDKSLKKTNSKEGKRISLSISFLLVRIFELRRLFKITWMTFFSIFKNRYERCKVKLYKLRFEKTMRLFFRRNLILTLNNFAIFSA
jgi:hypothetical protein